MDLSTGIEIISEQKNKPKYTAMIYTAGVITALLHQYKIEPIIVGGLSVEIYTQNDYATRDVDFVSEGSQIISTVLSNLGFKKEGEGYRHYWHEDIEVAIEIPDSHLDGDYNKVVRLDIDEERGLFVYLIAIEDIIHDRLKAAVHWNSGEDSIWGFKLLANNKDRLDLDYLYQKLETRQEEAELNSWLVQIDLPIKSKFLV